MALSIGIIGLPNVGKSTVFNALTAAQNAEVANYPFCTIQPNRAIVHVPDTRLDKLHQLVGVPDRIYATIEFVDIAGLVKGASKGEGLGNQFLGNIRDADALIHVVRCFEEPNVVHVSGQPEPRVDIEIVAMELILADLEQLENIIERLKRQIKGDKKVYGPKLDLALTLKDCLERGEPVKAFADQKSEVFVSFTKEMRFLTAKPVIYLANVDEAALSSGNECLTEVRAVAGEQDAEVIMLCASLEQELVDLPEEEKQEYLLISGVKENGLDQLIRKSHRLLNLISYFTMNENEVRAWTIPDGWTAPQAAGVIHTDFQKGFIRAEVISYDAFVQHGGIAATKTAGALRIEGKEYVVKDGEIIYFRFNL